MLVPACISTKSYDSPLPYMDKFQVCVAMGVLDVSGVVVVLFRMGPESAMKDTKSSRCA